jgi:hypothetical protein
LKRKKKRWETISLFRELLMDDGIELEMTELLAVLEQINADSLVM